MSWIDNLGGFTDTENLKAILGDLATTKRLGQTLGGLDETDNLKAILGALDATNNLKAILGAFDATNNLKQLMDMGLRPSISLDESWQDEAGIDATVWATALAGTGAVARNVAEPPYLKVLLNSAANNDTASLYSKQRWFCGPDTYGTNTLLRRLVLEFEAKLVNAASLLNTAFFMGLAATQGAYETTNDLIGIVLGADDSLESITDEGGVETTKTLVAAGFTGWHKYKIEVYAGTVDFYVDGVKTATHTTAAVEHLPDAAMYVNFYCPAEAAAFDGELHVGRTRVMTEDIAR